VLRREAERRRESIEKRRRARDRFEEGLEGPRADPDEADREQECNSVSNLEREDGR
jgi:hypothetical protein